MLLKKLHTSQRGDTLVEVLIAIAVISLILGGAFVMTNRSLQGTRDAQERVNATKLVEAQVEQIKGIAASDDSSSLFGPSAPTANYCITPAGSVVPDTDTECTVGVDGLPTTGQPAFRLTVSRTTTATTTTFMARATWTSSRGDAQNNVEMKYRAYEQ